MLQLQLHRIGSWWRTLRAGQRRGVVSVLAMMFLVLFGSLGLAMAVAARGNLRTASTHLHVTRAIGAAETGLAVARARLEEAAGRFVIDRGTVNRAYGLAIWDGTISGQGRVVVLPPPSGQSEFALPRGIAQALVSVHQADQNIIAAAGVSAPAMTAAPAGADLETFRADAWVVTPAVGIDESANAPGALPAAFQVTYAPHDDGTAVRIIVTGFSSIGEAGSGYIYNQGTAADRTARPVTRTVWQDFRITKRFRHAAISPSRILIGKNVNITGPIGARWTGVQHEDGDPVLFRSDFRGLDAVLDRKLADFYAGVSSSDANNDNRLRASHATEQEGLPAASNDYDSDGNADNAFGDATGDGQVDDFDIFLNHYDRNRDGRVALSAALRDGTVNEGLSSEFTTDDDLAILMDSARPDRNRNGVHGFIDANANGRWNAGETIRDPNDQVLGWRDGVIDRRDGYAKLRGSVQFRVTQQDWATANPEWRDSLSGPLVGAGGPPVQFGADENDLPTLDESSFEEATAPLEDAADGQPFDSQVATARGISTAQLASFVETRTSSSQPRYFPAGMDNAQIKALTGQNKWEKMPFNSPSFADWYIRPRYENMTFRNVVIPAGNNGLFVNCTFVGVTFIRTDPANTHPNWQLYGTLRSADNGATQPVPSTQPLDKSDFQRYYTGNVIDGPANYAQFPDPPTIGGALRTGAERDTKRYSNNIRFHNCLFVGSVASSTPSQFTNIRNKLQFTGSTRFSTAHPEDPTNPELNPSEEDLPEIAKSSLMAPNYSVEIGQFNSPTDTFSGGPTGQNVQLTGTIVAGVLDARGNTSIEGTLLMTYAPVLGEGPMVQYGVPVGNPANYNTSLGYFGPSDGDRESLDPETLPIVGGRRIVGWDLDGDGLPDLGPGETPSAAQIAAGAASVPFYGYGRIDLRWNPDMPMPDGIMLPLSVVPVANAYGEGRQL